MLGQAGTFDRVIDDVGAEVLMGAVVVLILVLIGGGIARRIYRYWSLRSLAKGRQWQWLGNSSPFGRLVIGAFPSIVTSARNSAHRGAIQSSHRRSGLQGVVGNAAGAALDLSGLGSASSEYVSGRFVAVATSEAGSVNVGEARVSVRTRRSRLGRGRRHGSNSSTSSTQASAAVANVAGQLPQIRLAPRTLLGRVLRRGGDDLPEELSGRFDVQELDGSGRAALFDSGAYRALVDAQVRVHGLTVADGTVAVMTRRRLSRKRAQALVHVLEQLVARLPVAGHTTGPSAAPLRAPVTQ